MSRLLYALIPLLGGGLIAAQAPINARLRTVLQSPVGSAFVSFAIGLAILLVALIVAGDAGRLDGLGGGPWWAYLGGACGAFFVIATLVAAPRIGVTTTFVAVVAGQLGVAALIDRYGWFGQPAIALSGERLIALGLMVLSLVLLVRQA